MNKLLLFLSVLSASTITFSALHRATERAQAARVSHEVEWEAATNRLAELNGASVSLRNEVKVKQRRLREGASHPEISLEMLSLFEGENLYQQFPAWADRESVG